MHRNQMVTQFLEEDFISTVSDRSLDQRLIDGQQETLRFLNQSIQATHQLLGETTGIVISESVFRQLLVKNKHIKTNSRQRKTAVCRQMSKNSIKYNKSIVEVTKFINKYRKS